MDVNIHPRQVPYISVSLRNLTMQCTVGRNCRVELVLLKPYLSTTSTTSNKSLDSSSSLQTFHDFNKLQAKLDETSYDFLSHLHRIEFKLQPNNAMVGREGRVELVVFKHFLSTTSARRNVQQITRFFVVFVDFSRFQ